MNEPAPIEIHKALADDTRYRLYRYLRLSGRPVAVRELTTRLGLHANTIRPHLRRLVDAGLVSAETRRGSSSAGGRPQTLYTALAALRDALADAGFDPRFRRRDDRTVEIGLRTCPFRDLLDEHRELVCTVHR